MKIHHILDQNSVLGKFVAEIRDVNVQQDRLRFRRNIERIGEVLAYELSKTLSFSTQKITTPLGEKEMNLMDDSIVLCSILRAGLPLHTGLLNYFDNAENAFISAYRKHKKNSDAFEIIVEYFASPSLENKTLILADPMLATGQSLVAVNKAIEKYGTPKQIHIVSVIAAQNGVDFIKNYFPKTTQLWLAALDANLNSKGYILPGLGDAGDLSYGEKLN